MSPNPALHAGTPASVQPFLYSEADRPSPESGGECIPAASQADRPAQEAAIREAGRKEGLAQARAEFAPQLGAIRENLSRALGDFARERQNYFLQVEAEVVRLALSMARKILHREAQVDPLLLAGLVRVALEQMERGTRVTVRVNPAQVAEYRSFFAQYLDADHLPEVEEDAALDSSHCQLHTSMGKTEMGLEVQLLEIERGLMDLLAQRPPVCT
jgi:flagellar assembly protein FliH